MEFYISGSIDYKRKQEFYPQGWQFLPPELAVGNKFSAKMIFLPRTLEGKRPHHLSGVEEEGWTSLQPQADAIILHCSFLGGMSGAAGHAQLWVLHSHWPKISATVLLFPFLLCICKCPNFITSMLMETVFHPVKTFPNGFSHCVLKIFLASKWSYLLPALVAVGAWRGRAGRAQGCASHPPYPIWTGIIHCSGLLGSQGRDSSPRTGQIRWF